jgi:hypothetical protein
VEEVAKVAEVVEVAVKVAVEAEEDQEACQWYHCSHQML